MSEDVVIRATANRAEASFDWSRVDSVAALVVNTVAEFADAVPTEVEPLHERIDADGLDVLFRPIEDDPARTEGLVEFPFANCVVTVHAEGRIVVRPGREPTER